MDMNNSTTPEPEKDLAQTPRWFVDALERYLGIRFSLDVCALKDTAKCDNYYSLQEGQDSLELDWMRYNYSNPPYSDIKPWVEKALQMALRGATTAMLIPDKPELAVTRRAREYADTIIHMPFRLNFIRPDGEPFLDAKGKKQGPKFPVMVVLFTPWGINLPVRDTYFDFRTLKVD